MLGAGERFLIATSEVGMLNKPKILTIHNQYNSPIVRKYALYNGVGYYRQQMPFRHLKNFTQVSSGTELVGLKEDEIENKVVELVKSVDMVFTKHLDNPYLVASLLGACAYYNKPLLVDFDDNVFSQDGREPEKFAYKEGDALHYLTTLLENCTAITVSVPSLQKVYEKYAPTHVLPNMVDMKDWKFERRKHDRPTVGWAGSSSHVVDHKVLEPVYQGVVAENPDVVFSFVGHMLPEHIKGLERKNWEIKPATDWWDGNPESQMTYPRLLAECGYDIGLAPLIDSEFNESRSLAKWFEYTMTGIPVVASNVGPYKELNDGYHALKSTTTNEWVENINYLLKNKDEQQRIVGIAKHHIRAKYSTDHLIPTWNEVFQSYVGTGFARKH